MHKKSSKKEHISIIIKKIKYKIKKNAHYLKKYNYDNCLEWLTSNKTLVLNTN